MNREDKYTPDTIEELSKRLNSHNASNWQHTLLPFTNNLLNKKEVYCFNGKIYIHYDYWIDLVFKYLGSKEQALDLVFKYVKLKVESEVDIFICNYKRFNNSMSISRKTYKLAYTKLNSLTIKYLLTHHQFN